jgi:CysZ protein
MLLFWGVYHLGIYFEKLEGSISADLKYRIGEVESITGLTWMTLKMIFYDKLYIIFTKFTLYIVIILLSPVLAIVSEKTEAILTGNKYPINLLQLWKDIKRAVRLNSRLILIEYSIIILFIAIGTLFGGSINTFLVFIAPIIIGFYFYGFGFIDYVNERRRLNIRQSIHFVSQNKGLAVAIGSVYSIFFLSYFYTYKEFATLPSDTNTQLIWGTLLVVTFILATITPMLAITSATLSMHEIVDLSKNKYAVKSTNDLVEKSEDQDLTDKNEASENEAASN